MVAIRYAKALFDASSDKHKYNDYLNTLSTAYSENDQVKEMLNYPLLTVSEKIEIVKEIINDEIFINFITLLLEKGRINLLNDIYKEYNSMLKKEDNILEMQIISAKEISEAQIKELVSNFKQKYKANKVNYEVKIDESLIGGIKVIIDDKVYDDSIATKLKDML